MRVSDILCTGQWTGEDSQYRIRGFRFAFGLPVGVGFIGHLALESEAQTKEARGAWGIDLQSYTKQCPLALPCPCLGLGLGLGFNLY